MAEGVQRSSGFATASLVLGIVGIVFSCIPFVNWMGWILCPPAIALGIVGIIRKAGKGKAITGVVLGGVGLIVATILYMVLIFEATNLDLYL